MMQRKILVLALVLLVSACQGPVIQTQYQPSVNAADYSTNTSRLNGVQSLIDSSEFEKAGHLISQISFEELTTSEKTTYAIQISQIYVKMQKPREALEWLAGSHTYLFDSLPQDQLIQIGLLRAEAREQTGQMLAAARERIFIAPVLSEPEKSSNHEQIWSDLQHVSAEELDRIGQKESSPDFRGWVQLALIANNTSTGLDQQVNAIKSWMASHPRHPAAKQLPQALGLLTRANEQAATHIALVLPLSGQLQRTGEAIRNGFMTAYYKSMSEQTRVPEITVVDSSSVENMQELYSQLVNDGVQMIVGPLEKRHVSQLAMIRNLPVPVLALNNVAKPDIPPANLYQFGLSPEGEARQAALKAYKDGYRNAAIIVPEGSWGNRVADAFTHNWIDEGGEVAAREQFPAQSRTKYLSVVRKLLNIDHSNARISELQQVINQPVSADPRRRQDIDVIFMAALPEQARQLKPLFDFQYASDIPIYATSNVYGGRDDPARNKDIEGIHFADMPWQIYSPGIKKQVYQVFGNRYVAGFDRLYAMGIDAYALYPRLAQLTVIPDARLHGVTGILSVDSRQHVERELTWARIKNGHTRPLFDSEDQF